MASAKLTKIAICFLIILLHLVNSSVNAYERSGRNTNFAANIIPYEEDAFLNKVSNYGDHKRLRGRKMLHREEEAKLDGSNHDEANISGSSVATTRNSFQIISSPAFEVSSNSKVHHQDSKKTSGDESQEIFEADDEVVNMMKRDYKGPNNPRHKPPINNHNPTDGP
ncbi:hypothetical protein Leryth_007811 [Lithospermum erythrorhizon]|nr:hypothetical protein Leryth_007811 [Lithospermum erythrorhizon]